MLKRPGTSPSAAAVARVAGAFDAFCGAERIPADVAWRLRLAIDEIVANIASHGAKVGVPPAIDVTFHREGSRVHVMIADDGPAFDPLVRPDPDTALPLEAREPGGLGIALVKSLMDEVRNERTTRNVLTLTKDIGAGGGDVR